MTHWSPTYTFQLEVSIDSLALQTSIIRTKAFCAICETLLLNRVAHNRSPMNSVISRLRSEKVKGDTRMMLFFLLTTYGIIMVNNLQTVPYSVGYLFTTNYCSIGQINRQVKVNYMMIIMIHCDPENFNLCSCVRCVSNIHHRVRVRVAGNIRENKTVYRSRFITKFGMTRRNVELVWCSLRHAVESHVYWKKNQVGNRTDLFWDNTPTDTWMPMRLPYDISYSKGLFEECGKLGSVLFKHTLTKILSFYGQ